MLKIEEDKFSKTDCGQFVIEGINRVYEACLPACYTITGCYTRWSGFLNDFETKVTYTNPPGVRGISNKKFKIGISDGSTSKVNTLMTATLLGSRAKYQNRIFALIEVEETKKSKFVKLKDFIAMYCSSKGITLLPYQTTLIEMFQEVEEQYQKIAILDASVDIKTVFHTAQIFSMNSRKGVISWMKIFVEKLQRGESVGWICPEFKE